METIYPADVVAEAEGDADFFDHPDFSLEDVLGLMEMERSLICRQAHTALQLQKAYPEGTDKHRAATDELEWNARRYAAMSLAKDIVRKRRQAKEAR